MIYIVRGTGHTVINYDGQPEERIDWAEGDLLGKITGSMPAEEFTAALRKIIAETGKK